MPGMRGAITLCWCIDYRVSNGTWKELVGLDAGPPGFVQTAGTDRVQRLDVFFLSLVAGKADLQAHWQNNHDCLIANASFGRNSSTAKRLNFKYVLLRCLSSTTVHIPMFKSDCIIIPLKLSLNNKTYIVGDSGAEPKSTKFYRLRFRPKHFGRINEESLA